MNTGYIFLPQELRLLPRGNTDYRKVDPNLIRIPAIAKSDAEFLAKTVPSVFFPSKRVELIEFAGGFFIASQGDKAFRDLLAISAALEKGDKVPAKVYVLKVQDPELYLRLNFGDMVDEEAFEKELGNLTTPAAYNIKESLSWKTTKPIVEAVEASNDLYDILVDYANGIVSGHGAMKKVPLLVGHTGVGKSALVKQLEAERGPDNYGFRVHTIKAGFMDKVDLLGYVEVKTVDGQRVAQDSPMYELMISTDAFVQEARDMLSHVDPKTLEYSDGNIRYTLSDVEYEKLRYFAKTPVLFFDEINRADPFIISTLMTLFSERMLNNYGFKKSVFITAANWPIDISDEDLEALYKVTLIQDPAQIDRFIVMRVSHNDPSVVDSTIRYLEDKYSSLPNVGDFLQDLASRGYFYNPELALDDDKELADTTFGSHGLGKFPTFRGWDNVLQYLSVKQAKGEDVYLDFIAGLVGNKAAKGAEDYITNTLGLSIKTSEEAGADVYDVFLKESYESGLPALLIGRFGLAKSSKVETLAEKSNAIYYRIDLQAMDRTTLRGYPDKQDLASVAFGDGSTLASLIKAKLDAKGEPLQTTRFTPFDFIKVVQEARETGRQLVVFFDEMNRADPVEQSAVFDAISEGKILGVDVSDLQARGQIKIVAAGNVGDEYASEDFDAAAVARFAVVTKNTVSDRDFTSFLTWAESKFHPQVVSWIADRKDYFIEQMNSESELDAGLVSDVFSFRTLEVINSTLANMTGTYTLSAFQTDIGQELALSVAASPKWRGNIVNSRSLITYRLVDGPDKGTKKSYQSFLNALGDVDQGYIDVEEFYSDILAVDSKRTDEVYKFLAAAIPGKVYLQIEDALQELVARVFREAFEADESVSDRLADATRNSIPESMQKYYDQIAEAINTGNLRGKLLYDAALERYLQDGGDIDSFGDSQLNLAISEILSEIESLGIADTYGVSKVVETVIADNAAPIEVIFNPKMVGPNLAQLQALGSVVSPGDSGVIPFYQGVSDFTLTIDGDTISGVPHPRDLKTGIARLLFKTKKGDVPVAIAYGWSASNDSSSVDPVQVRGTDVIIRSQVSKWNPGEDSEQIVPLIVKFTKFKATPDVSDIAAEATEVVKNDSQALVPARSIIRSLVDPQEVLQADRDVIKKRSAFAGIPMIATNISYIFRSLLKDYLSD